ncbi:hypothetical protein [Helicobacter ganmani]
MRFHCRFYFHHYEKLIQLSWQCRISPCTLGIPIVESHLSKISQF